MLQLDFKPNLKSIQTGDPMLPEPALDTLRLQAIQLHRRKNIIMILGVGLLGLSMLGLWYYFMEDPNPETKILEQSGVNIPDYSEDMEPAPVVPQEPSSAFKVEVIDDGPLFAQAEEALLQRNWPVAIQKHKALIALYPHNNALWFNLALAYHHHGDLEQARYWYEKVLLHKAGHKSAKHNLKVLHEANAYV